MSREKGMEAENMAVSFLVKSGFEIIDRNFFSKFGEIDIIAKKGGVVHFVEVKSGKNFEPIYAITHKKMEKIIKSINYYILKNSLSNIEFCIDGIIIKGEGENIDIELFENITF